MSERRGVLSAGTWCVDFNKSIARWPDEDTSNEVLAIDRDGGGSGFNMALDLKRLDPDFPVEAMGLVGDDDLGRFLFGECDAHGVAHAALSRDLPGHLHQEDRIEVCAFANQQPLHHGHGRFFSANRVLLAEPLERLAEALQGRPHDSGANDRMTRLLVRDRCVDDGNYVGLHDLSNIDPHRRAFEP